jgi:UDP-N-acetylmuramate dehydrogenase
MREGGLADASCYEAWVNRVPEIRADIALGACTTLGLGGNAEFFLDATNTNALNYGLAWAAKRGLAMTILGGGSNLVVADAGVDGLVIRIGMRGIERTRTASGERWRIAAGEVWDDVVAAAVAADLQGIECLSGIPGRVGAAPVQNIGAYGQELADTLVATHITDRSSGEARILANEECGFGYRTSAFKRGDAAGVVVAVELLLARGRAPTLRYPELQRAIADHGPLTLATVRETVLALRRQKSMLLDPDDENGRTAGSFFLNPLLLPAEADALELRAHAAGVLEENESLPRFPAPDGYEKIPAAWLIERAGFAKGTRRGAVGISSRHSLALVHHGGGTTRELLAFAEQIQDKVAANFGIHLSPEPVILG